MGYIKHHTIIVTGWQEEKLKEANRKAKEVFEKHVSTGGSNTMLPAVSRQYRPTAEQWRKVTTETAFFAEEVTPCSRVELIDFNK